MLNGVRIFSSDNVWRQILTDLGAVVLDAPTVADINLDLMDLNLPVTPLDFKATILGAMDNSDILCRIFGADVHLPRPQAQIVSLLSKSGGMTISDLKIALGYSPDATTHAVDTAIYQLRKVYGREFIRVTDGVYSIGKL